MVEPKCEWNRERLERLRKTHAKALELNAAAFDFEGDSFDTRYAGYLIQYLETQFQLKGW